ncbi:carbohydrate ABC transporter permease [Vallitalea guaymasensis]|uniref:carbohydrate ABC transporter permease n=1 Tax=Vallitalea guaymasensis TaxID=1185412 RepID=UPI002E8E265B|nr:carbohydrate ABC transporter permease [Vallitalea guaymasensis]
MSMKKKNKKLIVRIIAFVFLSLLGIFMTYPLLWLISSSLKENSEIFKSLSLIPQKIVMNSYSEGWKGVGQFGYSTFFGNTFKLVIPITFFTVISSTIVGYGFARFTFPFKKFFFSVMLAGLMLPSSVIIIPRYLLFNRFGWLDSYLPFIVPAMFATNAFFIFMMVQFFRGIPKELDEAGIIDGCNSLQILTRILLPLCKPAIFSAMLFQFIWAWSDFFSPLIYINSVKKYPLSLALRMMLDLGEQAQWNQIMAMSVLSIVPPVILFFTAQKYFVEGISTSGLKG